ncbi:MAG TPA: RDD family protein, partial [Acidimicrobiales bacterium]
LSAALSRGCVHRDVKPANLLLHSSGVWKLCDFGTARLVPEGATHPVTQVIGTSPYMSAAALRGQQNHAADLYALGVTVHEALCGRLLHPRPPEMSEVDYARAVIETPPTISPALPRRWQTTVAALIGLHGPLDAPTLAAWFRATRGHGEPPTPPGGGPGLRRTLATEVASAAPAVAPAAVAEHAPPPPPPAPARRMFVPAPPEPAPGAPPPPPPPPGGPAAPGQPAAARPAVGGAMAPGGTPLWARALQAIDPSRVLRRRAVALAIDLVVVAVLIVLWYFGSIYATYTRIDAATLPAEVPPCQAVGEYWDCWVSPNDDVYISRNLNPVKGLFVVGPALLVLVVLQGRTGYTPGKFVRNLRVVGIDRRPPGMRRALVRTALWAVDGFPWFVPLLGLLVAGKRRDRRRIGDLVAKTWVIDRKPPPGV